MQVPKKVAGTKASIEELMVVSYALVCEAKSMQIEMERSSV